GFQAIFFQYSSGFLHASDSVPASNDADSNAFPTISNGIQSDPGPLSANSRTLQVAKDGSQDVALVLAAGAFGETGGKSSLDLIGGDGTEAKRTQAIEQGRMVGLLRGRGLRAGRLALVEDDVLAVHADAGFSDPQVVLNHRRREIGAISSAEHTSE